MRSWEAGMGREASNPHLLPEVLCVQVGVRGPGGGAQRADVHEPFHAGLRGEPGDKKGQVGGKLHATSLYREGQRCGRRGRAVGAGLVGRCARASAEERALCKERWHRDVDLLEAKVASLDTKSAIFPLITHGTRSEENRARRPQVKEKDAEKQCHLVVAADQVNDHIGPRDNGPQS